jgi:hypothetical protein
MPHYTPEEYASLLLRAFTPRLPRDCRPTAVSDTADKGEEILEMLLPNPSDRRFSVSLTAHTLRGTVAYCELRFGQAEVASRLDPEEAVAAMETILSDSIVAIVRYKNRDAYDGCRKAAPPSEWLYQLPDDAAELEAMLARLKKPASFMDKLSGRYVGVFEAYRWSGSEIINRC